MPAPSPRRGVLGGTIALAWVAGLYVAAPIVGGFALTPVGEWIIRRSPGWLSTMAVQLFGFDTKLVLVVSLIAAIAIAGGIAAAFVPVRTPQGGIAILSAATIVTAWLFAAIGRASVPDYLLGVLVTFAPPLAITWYANRSSGDVPTDRRRFLRVGAALVGAGLGLAGARRLLGLLADSPVSQRVEEPLERSVTPPSGEGAFDFGDMPAAVTPPEDHYVVDINLRKPTIDPGAWTLDVEGAVTEPYALTYEELLGHEGSVEQTTTMICISNTVGGDLVSTGHWTGVPLSRLIEDADPDPDAVDLVTHAADGYSEAIPMDLVAREDILIAYGLGERTLATDHGFPARLLVPGRYGMKMTKWIDRIEVVSGDHEAYWERRGWNEAAVVNTQTYVRSAMPVEGGILVGGVAFGGLETGVEEIGAVEVRVGEEGPWQDATLEGQLAPHAWRRWRHLVSDPPGGSFQVTARAVRSDGTVQTAERSSPRPNGATGWHRYTVSR